MTDKKGHPWEKFFFNLVLEGRELSGLGHRIWGKVSQLKCHVITILSASRRATDGSRLNAHSVGLVSGSGRPSPQKRHKTSEE